MGVKFPYINNEYVRRSAIIKDKKVNIHNLCIKMNGLVVICHRFRHFRW